MSYSRLGNQGRLWTLSPLTTSIGQSLFLGHAHGSLDYPTRDIISPDLQGPHGTDYRRVVI